ncbi:hypothetical protein [Nonomuraea turcica]|uniref:hypothetical protein n=1 Tax=Nonomuraea sp. G32 TaxID=3067274 RepID=UPI00273C86F9|nr:hypothetical protein [Nonomuraea sp. G32]MDP4501437.1 hypothetical protein [Nonomuraea sp. G32]
MSSREPFDEPLDELQAELLALGDLIDVPAPPPADVAAAVRARLESTPQPPNPASPSDTDPDADAGAGGESGEGPDPAHGPYTGPVRPARSRPPGRRDGGRPARRGRRWTIVAAVVVVVIAITAATPQGRAAVARILRFAGVELEIGESTPPPVTTTASLPGERTVPPSGVRSQARFEVRIPGSLGPPQSASVADNGRVVSLFWPGGIRLDQFDGAVDPIFFKKAGPPYPDFVKVGPYQAFWLEGEHPLGYIARQDGTRVPLRQAAATLIWSQDTINYRLEGVRTKEEAITIAESLQ